MVAGGCLCGAVRYEVAGEPKFSVLCYCRDCQKAPGRRHVPVMGMPRGSVKISGETKTYTNRGESGRMAVRHFCPVCGSLLFGTPDRERGDVNLYIGTLDDPSVFKPTCAIFVRSRAPWDRDANALPAHTALPLTAQY